MGLVSRGAALAAALAAGVITAGCGGSVADSDSRRTTLAAPPPQSAFCAAAQANVDAIRPLNSLVTRGGGASPEELSNTVDAVRRAGAEMVNAAPNEIRLDVERTAQAVGLQLDALLANGGDAAAIARDPQLSARVNSPENVGASERVRGYVNDNCDPTRATTR